MPASAVEIANSALVKVGAKTINNFDEDSVEANVCKLRYEPCRDTVFRMHPWNCLIKRARLAPLTASPSFGYAYQFELPVDCLRVLYLLNNGVVLDDYRIEGRRILTDAGSIDLKYIFRNESPTEYDYLLAEAVALYLAKDICYKFTTSSAQIEELTRNFDKAIRKAKAIDAQEEPSPELVSDHLIHARTSYLGMTPGAMRER